MNKTKMTIVIVCTVLAMILVAVGLVMWLLPGNGSGGETNVPGNTTQSVQSDATQSTDGTGTTDPIDTTVGDQTEDEDNSGATQATTQPTGGKEEEPTVGVDVDVDIEDDLGGSEGNGNSGGENSVIDFEDLLNP